MKKLLVLALVSFPLLAVDPPYFTDPIAGNFLPDMFARGTTLFTPGNLGKCTPGPTVSPSVSIIDCDLIGASLKIDFAGKTLVLPFEKLSFFEMIDTKGFSQMTFSFVGNYREVFADGSVLETASTFYFDQNTKTPEKLYGRVSLGAAAVGGTVLSYLAKR